MESAFNLKTGEWELAWPERITQHDLVYLSPPGDPMQGVPLGNGDVGALLWCEPSRIIIALNKCDLWDDAEFDSFRNWHSDEEDKSTTLRHAGRLIIDFGVPLMDLFYLKDFECRLDLASAQVRIFASTPFGKLNFSAYVSATEGALVINCQTDLSENISHDVFLERWGSRAFFHWYAKVRRDPSIGLAGTDVSVQEEDIFLTHQLTSGQFAVGCRVFPKNDTKSTSKRLHSRQAKYEIESEGSKKQWSLLLSVSSPSEKGTAKEAVMQTFATIAEEGQEQLWLDHQDFWKKFWSKSYINIPNDYLENLWYLTMYYAGSSQRGAWPATFVNGLWGWNRDVHPWGFYFHWNQQMLYWPLHAAGHHDLLLPYLKFRFESLPHAIHDAKELFGTDGAYIADVTDRRGYNDQGDKDYNHTPVGQIAMDFWRYYRYTGDKIFLREKGLPFMTKAAEFFESLLEKRADGFYHAKSGTPYEGRAMVEDLVEDAVTELSTAKALFENTSRAAEELGVDLGEKMQRWKNIAQNLCPLITVQAPEEVISESDGALKLKVGAFMGSDVPTRKIIAAGRRLTDGDITTSRIYSPEGYNSEIDWNDVIPSVLTPPELKCRYPVMPFSDATFLNAEFCPVFPTEICGLGDENSSLFKSCVSTVKAYSPDIIGWEPTSIVLARLGLAEEAMALLEDRPDKWQIYCNGFWRANSEERTKYEGLFYFGVNKVLDADRDETKFDIAAWPYRHMESESMSVSSCAINEMLLQSYDGIIRIAPAFKWDGEFTLHAVGGFVVSSQIKNGQVQWVAIKSLLGNLCEVKNPWGTEQVYIFRDDSITQSASEDIISFDTAEGNTYILSTDKNIKKNWSVKPRIFKENKASKTSKNGMAHLGLSRMF